MVKNTGSLWVRVVVVAALACCLVLAVGCGASGASSKASSSSVASPSTSSSSPTPSASGVLPESEWGDLFATIGEGAVAFGQRVQEDLPVKAYACWQGVGGGEPIWFDDPADIQALFNALASSNIAGEATTMTTDDYYSFGFEFSNGETYGFMFDSMVVQVKDGDSWKFYNVAASPDLAAFAHQAQQYTMRDY